jgi:hypothetical protein
VAHGWTGANSRHVGDDESEWSTRSFFPRRIDLMRVLQFGRGDWLSGPDEERRGPGYAGIIAGGGLFHIELCHCLVRGMCAYKYLAL